jgi:hypothetical protein
MYAIKIRNEKYQYEIKPAPNGSKSKRGRCNDDPQSVLARTNIFYLLF